MQEQQITYPYDDNNMVFDPSCGQYVLTENALLSRGINLRADADDATDVSPDAVIENLTRLASDMVYGFIHGYGADDMMKDRLIACLPSLRPIIYNAMLYQLIYVRTVGNLYLSTDQNERDKAIDEIAKQWLRRTVPEIGTSILYAGV